MEETGEIQKNSSENKKDLIHVEIHVDHFKAKLNQLKIVDLKLQNKLKKLYKIHNQFSLLLNRGIEKKYNFTQKSKETIQRKIALPPLPHIQNDSISNLLSTLHGASPNKLKMYIRENGILKNLIFGESSVFNDQLLDALTRAPPDIQISFIEVIIEEISKCASIYSKFVHSFSKFIKDNDLISRFTDSKVSNENFYQPYKKMLKELAEILFSEKCTFVFYSDMNDNLFYPINNFFYAISIDNSLSGILFKSNTPQRFESPNNHSLFDVTTEQFVFDENKSILSVPIQLNESSNMIGIIVFSRQNRYSSADEVTIQKAALYLAPIFNLFRVFFISMTPNQYPQLFRSIASIRRSDNFLKTLQSESCKLSSGTFCKIFTVDAEFWERYGIQILPSEPSLIRKSFESSKPLSFKNPRTVIGFNKSVDDELSLSKLTTLLIVPIPSTSLIIVLYNTSISNQFGSKNIFSMSLFAKSILPLFYQSPLNKSMENDDDIEMKCTKYMLSFLPQILKELDSKSIFSWIESFLPQKIKLNIFYFINEDEAVRFPQNKIYKASEFLKNITQITSIDISQNDTGFEDFLEEDAQKIIFIPESLNRKSI